MPSLFWIETGLPGRMATMPRPLGGPCLRREIEELRVEGVDVLVSLLSPAENRELGMWDQDMACRDCGIEFRSLPIVDRGIPNDMQSFREGAEAGLKSLRDGKTVAVHCRMGIGRSTLFAASILVLAGIDDFAALSRIERARGCRVPDTTEQRLWLAQFARQVR